MNKKCNGLAKASISEVNYAGMAAANILLLEVAHVFIDNHK